MSEWCTSMEKATGLGLPWRMLKEKLVTVDPESQKVNYSSTFENISSSKINVSFGIFHFRICNSAICSPSKAPAQSWKPSTVTKAIWKQFSALSTKIIQVKLSQPSTNKLIPPSHAGYISLDEFSEACNLIKEHMPNPITQEQLVEICRLMDINKDGLVDLNEFLETFRLVDPESRHLIDTSPTKTTNVEINAQNSPEDSPVTPRHVTINTSPKSPKESSLECNNTNNVLTQSPVLSSRRGD